MKCEDYICDNDECIDICSECDKMMERSCINCAMNEDCDGDSSYHDKLDHDEMSAES